MGKKSTAIMATTASGAKKKATPKQIAWLNHYTNPESPGFLNKTESAVQAGYGGNRNSANRIGQQTAAALQTYIDQFLDELGLSEEALKKRLIDGLDAMITRFFSHEGNVTDQKDCVDWETRRKYLDMAIKLKGIYPAEKREHSGKVNVQHSGVIGVVAPPAFESVEAWESAMREMLRRREEGYIDQGNGNGSGNGSEIRELPEGDVNVIDVDLEGEDK